MRGSYREHLLTVLSDGEWHPARELRHPQLPGYGLDAFVRILRSEGHEIEIDRSRREPRYRLGFSHSRDEMECL
jgi:hypothetical protein